MKIGLHILILVASFWLGAFTGHAAESPLVKSGRITAQLVTSYDRVAPGDDVHIALSLRMDKHWHTYWRNAGGPGEPARIVWTLPDTLSVGEITWPLPKIVHTGPIINYAFEDRLLLPMTLHISEDAVVGDVLNIQAEAEYLVCYQVCLPESAILSLSLTIGEPLEDGRWAANIKRTLKNAPKPEAGFKASAQLESGKLIIDIQSDDLRAGQFKNPYFYPYVQDTIDADVPQIPKQGTQGLRLSMAPGWKLEDGLKDTIMGVIAYDKNIGGRWQRRGVVVEASMKPAVDIGTISAATTAITGSALGLITAAFSAFLGGMILNLMPCVFPVLSLKVLGFAKAAHEDKALIRQHGLMYTAGVLVSFLSLAAILLALKASGAAIGWGFQLQNPVMVSALALLFFVIALNLFGFFEIGGRWQGAGGDLARSEGLRGAFFTGVLVVIVATPCTAPFMAGALGYALAQPALSALLVFFALGLGFALPFLALSYAPALLARMPKPGAWMETFKQALAFPMCVAAIWLLWVLSGVGDENGVVLTLLSALGITLAIWGLQHKSSVAKGLGVIGALLCIYFLFSLKPATDNPTALTQEAWSPERVAQLRAEGHPVFVDFTARWCVTCKVNERLVLHTQAGKALLAQTDTKMLIADWTRKDDRIADELARHGRSGVPLYLVYSPGTDASPPQILPQTLTFKTLEKALKTAQKQAD